MFVLFAVIVLANWTADAMDPLNKHGGGEFLAHTEDSLAPAGISTVVFAACAFVFAALACVGVWLRRDAVQVFGRRRRTGIEMTGDDSSSSDEGFSYINLESDADASV